jgi:hypothetical protein
VAGNHGDAAIPDLCHMWRAGCDVRLADSPGTGSPRIHGPWNKRNADNKEDGVAARSAALQAIIKTVLGLQRAVHLKLVREIRSGCEASKDSCRRQF